MLGIKIVFVSVVVSLCYSIMIRQGELLQGWSRFINLNINYKLLKKLLTCPYCIAGQIALWSSVYFLDWSLLLSVPCAILLTYILNKEI